MPYRRGLNEGSQYFDPWRNPYLMRGVPESQHSLGQGRTTLAKPPAVPFHTAVGGNKSVTLPTTFDVIRDAEESGGVCHRHSSATARFGVPDTCDVADSDAKVDGFLRRAVDGQAGQRQSLSGLGAPRRAMFPPVKQRGGSANKAMPPPAMLRGLGATTPEDGGDGGF